MVGQLQRHGQCSIKSQEASCMCVIKTVVVVQKERREWFNSCRDKMSHLKGKEASSMEVSCMSAVKQYL